MLNINYYGSAEKEILKLDHSIVKRLVAKIEWMAAHPEALHHPLKYISHDLRGLQKYRIGKYRILYQVDHQKNELAIYGIEHRKTVYEDL